MELSKGLQLVISFDPIELLLSLRTRCKAWDRVYSRVYDWWWYLSPCGSYMVL